MKKLFTLITVALMAISANAHTWIWSAPILEIPEMKEAFFVNGYGLVSVTYEAGSKTDVFASSGYYKFSGNAVKLTFTLPEGKTFKAGDSFEIVTKGGKSGSPAWLVIGDNASTTAYPDKTTDEAGSQAELTTTVTLSSSFVESNSIVIRRATSSESGGGTLYLKDFAYTQYQPKKLNAASIAGTYNAHHVGTSYIRGGYASWVNFDENYNSTVTVEGTTVKMQAYFGGNYLYTITGNYDAEAETITFQPQSLGWMILADTTSAETPVVASCKLDVDSVRISFPPFNIWYGGYAYENHYSFDLVAPYVEKLDPVCEWTTEANITYYDLNKAVVFSGKCNISRWANKPFLYQVTNYNNPESEKEPYTDAVLFNKIEGTDSLTLDYSNAYNGYYYWVLSSGDDMWMEGGDSVNSTIIEGNDEKGQLTWYYWRYDLNNNYEKLSEGNVVVSWPYVESTVVAGDANEDGTVSVADLSLMAGYILNGTAEGINLKNADMNGDGEISVADLSQLASVILSGN